MIYEMHIPKLPLGRFIECIIYFEEVTFEHTVDRLLPNGDTEILIDLNDTPQYVYDNDTLKEIQACHNVWASGLRTEPITIPSGNGSKMMVIMCKKGMAYPFFPFPMDEISDCVVDADLIWGMTFARLRERLLDAGSIAEMFTRAEEFLVKNFLNSVVVNPCVEYAMAEILRQPDHLNLGRMSSKIGYSQKHFIGMFKKHVGVTPKAYLKIMRFQKAIAEIERAGKISWTALSQDCGFYDQAHFINDFKLFSGFTPEHYLRQRGGFVNYIPVG